MELHTIRYKEKDTVVLLDDNMKLVKPIYNYLRYIRQKDRAFNTIKANCSDLKLYWDFLNKDIPYPDTSKEIGILENIKSKGKTRHLYIPMDLLEEIDNFIMEERNNIDTEHSYIFVSQQKQNLGKPLTYRAIYEVLNTVKKKTGIELNFHDLRHTCTTALVQSGMDINVVKIILGHEHITTTQQYTHISNKYLEDSLSRYWNKSSLIGG